MALARGIDGQALQVADLAGDAGDREADDRPFDGDRPGVGERRGVHDVGEGGAVVAPRGPKALTSMRTAASRCRRRSGRTRAASRRRRAVRRRAGASRSASSSMRPNPAVEERPDRTREQRTGADRDGPVAAAPRRSMSARRRPTEPSGDRAGRGGRYRVGTATCRYAPGRGALSWSPPRCRRYSCRCARTASHCTGPHRRSGPGRSLPSMLPARFAPVLDELAPLVTRFATAATGCTSSADPCAICSCSTTGRISISISPPTPDRGDQGLPRRMGRRDVDPGREVRHDRRAQARPGQRRDPRLRDHHVPCRGLHRRLAQAARGVRRRHRQRSLAARLHRQRDGARAHRRRRRRRRSSIRSAVPPISRRGRCGRPPAPEVSFGDDPLRMLRAARFIAGYQLEPTEELTAAVRAMAGRLEIVSPERIRDEFDKLITVDHPSAGLWFLVDTGLADQFLPELPAMRLEHDPIHRHKDVLTHTIAVVENVPPRHPRPATAYRLPPDAAGGAVPRHRQAQDPRLPRGQGHDVPSSRRGRRPDDAQADEGDAVLERRRRQGVRTGGVASAVPHLRDGLVRLGGASVRPRRRRSVGRTQRADPMRLHDAQRDARRRGCRGGWTNSRSASSSWVRPRSWLPSGPNSTATR